jgi:uncharacterized membrane protein
MDKRVLKVLLIMIACVLLVVSAVFVFMEHSYSEFFTGVLYGAIGVGFFVVMAKILSLIQKEGKQDD